MIEFSRKPTKKGRNLIPLTIRTSVWEIWHNSYESTNTTQLVKLRLTDKSHIQLSLEFKSSVNVVVQVDFTNYETKNERGLDDKFSGIDSPVHAFMDGDAVVPSNDVQHYVIVLPDEFSTNEIPCHDGILLAESIESNDSISEWT